MVLQECVMICTTCLCTSYHCDCKLFLEVRKFRIMELAYYTWFWEGVCVIQCIMRYLKIVVLNFMLPILGSKCNLFMGRIWYLWLRNCYMHCVNVWCNEQNLQVLNEWHIFECRCGCDLWTVWTGIMTWYPNAMIHPPPLLKLNIKWDGQSHPPKFFSSVLINQFIPWSRSLL